MDICFVPFRQRRSWPTRYQSGNIGRKSDIFDKTWDCWNQIPSCIKVVVPGFTVRLCLNPGRVFSRSNIESEGDQCAPKGGKLGRKSDIVDKKGGCWNQIPFCIKGLVPGFTVRLCLNTGRAFSRSGFESEENRNSSDWKLGRKIRHC